jgi:hypothetical protein
MAHMYLIQTASCMQTAYTRVLPDANLEEVRKVWSRMDSQVCTCGSEI